MHPDATCISFFANSASNKTHSNSYIETAKDKKESPCRGGGSHMKGAGMLVVSLRRANVGFWSHLGCSGKNAIIFNRQGCARRNIKLYIFNLFYLLFRGQKSLDHAQIGLLKISDEHARPFHMGVPPGKKSY